MTFATALEKPALPTNCWIVSTCKGRRFLDLNGTYAREAEPASSKLSEVQVVHRPAGTKDRRTSLSAARMEPLGPTRALSKAALSTRSAEEEQRVEKHKLTGCPKSVRKHPASMPMGLGLETCTVGAWHSFESRKGQGGDARRPRRSPRTSSARETTPSEWLS